MDCGGYCYGALHPAAETHASFSWADTVRAAVLDRYSALPQTGKARDDGSEWTALAAFLVSVDAASASGRGLLAPRVIALGTGTKCVGASGRCASGTVVHDCHAEVVARRALLCYIYEQLALAATSIDDPDCIFHMLRSDDRVSFSLKPGVKLHMFCSQPPCGDASLAGPTCRTGAKLLGDVPLDDGTWREAGGGEQQAGVTRRKPGRGEPTLSVSCSDKLARWTSLGVQGACLMHFLAAPLRIDTLTVAFPQRAGDTAFSVHDAQQQQQQQLLEASVRRAVDTRMAALAQPLAGTMWVPRPPEVCVVPGPSHKELCVPPSSTAGDTEIAPGARGPSACGSSLNWFAGAPSHPHGGVEVITGNNGRKAGATKRTTGDASAANGGTTKTRSRLCRAALLERFRSLIVFLHEKAGGDGTESFALPALHALEIATYGQVKARAPGGYARARATLMSPASPLSPWIPKPDGEQDFTT